MKRTLNLRLKPKLILIFTLLALSPFVIISIISYRTSEEELQQNAFDKLHAVNQIKQTEIEWFFNEAINEAHLFASMPFLSKAIYNLDTISKEAIKAGFREKRLLDYIPFKNEFKKHYPLFKNYLRSSDYADILILSPNSGRVVLSVKLEDDFGTELASESTHLAKAWKLMRSTQTPVTTDYAAYKYSKGKQTIFIITPAFKNKKYIGSIGIELSPESINKFIQERTGMGKTGETYIIGQNAESKMLQLKTDRIVKEGKIGDIKTDSVIKKCVENGEHGTEIKIGSTGAREIVSYSPLNIKGLKWGIFSTMAVDEAFGGAYKLRTIMLIIGIITIAIVSIIGYFFSASISNSIFIIVENIQKIAEGDLNLEKIQAKSKDEIGDISIAFNQMLVNLNSLYNQAKMIASADLYNKDLNTDKGKGMLSDSFAQMIVNLRKADESQKNQNWLKTGQTQLNQELRGDIQLVDLCRNILNFISDYLDTQVGVIYIVDDDNTIKSVASYAFDERKGLSNSFKPGEGLVGQSALEKKAVLFTEIPEDYIKIYSGLGNIPPKNIYILPLIYKDSVKGVIELGAVHTFTEHHIQFLETIAESIAISINTIQTKDLTEQLYEDSQQKGEELLAQQEELKTANEELQEQSAKLKASEESLQAQQEELRATNEELEEKTEQLEKQKTAISQNNINLEKSRKILKQKANELALSTKYKSEFLANMSHELRTPLNSLMLLSKNLSKNKDKNFTEKQVNDLNLIYMGGHELLNLINDILDLSKIEAGKMTINRSDVFYSDLKLNINNSFKQIADEKGLELKVTIDKKLPESLYTDQQKLEQILKNLISNAIKFTATGNIEIAFRKPAEDENTGDSELKHAGLIAVSVSDTGIGIPEEKFLDIFEAFQQVDGTTSREHTGTGLGLSISKELAILLGGKVEVESREGQGSTFTVFIAEHLNEFKEDEYNGNAPAFFDEKTEYSEEDFSAEPLKTVEDDRGILLKNDKVILIIEDDLKFTYVLGDYCHEKGFKFIHAVDGETGLSLVSKYSICAIILDIHLPGLDGWSILKKLKSDMKTRHIPVHIISVDSPPSDVLLKGAIGYLTKPVKENDLRVVFNKITRLVSGTVKKLLIVEDNPVESEHLKDIFSSAGVNIEIASKGKTAFEKINKNKYDVMILDLILPDISGFELLKQIDTLDLQQRPAIIINTAKEISAEESLELNKYTSSLITKGPSSNERLLDETALFLHSVVDQLPESAKEQIKGLYADNHTFMGKKILIVDDDVRNIYSLNSILEDFNMEIHKAGNGEIALNILKDNPDIDLIIMDIMMPVMDGYKAIEEIRKQDKHKKLPIIAMTAKVMQKDREQCIKVGATDYLAKPVDPDKLISTIRVWLHK